MKKFLLFIAALCSFTAGAQQHACAKGKQTAFNAKHNSMHQSMPASVFISHELKYDVKFVHLDLELERTSTFIKGSVKTVATVTAAPLDTFMTLLHQNHTIDSLRFNGMLLPVTRVDSIVKVKMPSSLSSGTTFTVVIYYKGVAPNSASQPGGGYCQDSVGWYGNAAVWSLSEPFGAYEWWPCKQILTDKIDSSWVTVTTDSTNKVGSNGILMNVTLSGGKKKYEWRSNYTINYYLVSVAIAEYMEYNLYAKPQYLPNDSILIQNYIYKSAWSNSGFQVWDKPALDMMPATLEFFCNMYGMYPYYKEKYGHCMGSWGGAMEHQTMTSTGFFDFYIDAHELGHQWWGDNVTCKSWADIWINEGFATYSEILISQYLDPSNFTTKLNDAHNYVMSDNGGSCFFTGNDTLNAVRIFDGRLTYAKGGAIIHSLRFLTNNDSLWFNTLRGFQNTYKNGNASVTDFKNYYTAQTGINATQFFNQWFYGEGYPIFKIKYNQVNNICWINNVQNVSKPTVTPLFITPVEYAIKRIGFPDTIVRVMHSASSETYSFVVTGTVTTIITDPKNWLINKTQGPIKDLTLGVNTTSINDNILSNQNIFISPNPSGGIFEIQGANPGNTIARVYGIDNKLLFEKSFDDKTSIDLSAYPAGIYLVRFCNDEGIEVAVRKLLRL